MFGFCKNADMCKHGDMGQRTPYVMSHKASVEEAILGRLEALDLFIHTVALLP